MAIQFPGGTTLYTQIAAGTKAQLIDNMKAQLVLAGWTASDLFSEINLVFTSLPGDGQTCAFDGQTYTFKTVLASAYDVLIGPDAAGCASNLAAAINDSGGEGVIYGTGTAAHPTVQASVNTATARVFSQTAGYTAFSASEGLNNATLDTTTSRYGGWKLTSGLTPQGNRGVVRLYDPQRVDRPLYINVRVEAYDDPTIYADFGLAGVGRTIEVRACQYEFETWVLSAAAIEGCELQVSVPHIRDGQKAPVVSAVTDSGGLFKITTDVAHNLVTGDHVFISGAEGQTGINGNWQVTVIDTTSYTLDGSTFAFGYTADSARAAAFGRGQVSRLIVALGYQESANNAGTTFRNSLAPNHSDIIRYFTVLNQFYSTGIGNAQQIQLLGIFGMEGTRIDNWGIIPDLIEPRIAFKAVPGSGLWYSAGQLWGAVIVMKPVDMDITKSGWNGHNWIQYTNNYANGSLWLATN